MRELIVSNCRQLVTLAGPPRPRAGPEMRDLAIIPDGAMLIHDSRIHAVGRRDAIEPLATSDVIFIDAGGRIVLPGFIDAHTHPVFAGTRADEFEQRIEGATYQEIAAAGGGIRSTVRRTREAAEDRLVLIGRNYRRRFLAGGTTTIEAKSGYGLSLDGELKLLHVIRRLSEEGGLRYVPTFLGAHEIPDEYRGRTDAYVELVSEEMLPRVRKESLADFCDVFCEPNVFPLPMARIILSAARALGLGIRLHADQFSSDHGSALAAELHAATADHLEHTSTEGLQELLRAGVQPVLLPGAVYYLGTMPYPKARVMIDMGLAVVLATDFNPGSSPTASMPLVLSLASTQMKMTPAEAITAATMNAACSLARGNDLGSLEAGKLADFAIHDCDDFREIPYFARDCAVRVFVGGECIYGM